MRRFNRPPRSRLKRGSSPPVPDYMPKYELLKEAYAIIDGIPDELFDLSGVLKTGAAEPSCNTIACAIGWLAMHPKGKALGLRLDDDTILRVHGVVMEFDMAAALLFGMDQRDAFDMFGTRDWNEAPGKSDKQAWQKRVRRYLKMHGQL